MFGNRHLIHAYADIAGLVPRIIFPVPVLTPKLSSLWIHLVTPVPSAIASPLAEGLSIPVVCRDNRTREIVPLTLQPAKETIRIALDRQPQAEQDACDLPIDLIFLLASSSSAPFAPFCKTILKYDIC